MIFTPLKGRSVKDLCVDLFKFDKNGPNIEHVYMLFTGREVRMGKNCARGLEYDPRPKAGKKSSLWAIS